MTAMNGQLPGSNVTPAGEIKININKNSMTPSD